MSNDLSCPPDAGGQAAGVSVGAEVQVGGGGGQQQPGHEDGGVVAGQGRGRGGQRGQHLQYSTVQYSTIQPGGMFLLELDTKFEVSQSWKESLPRPGVFLLSQMFFCTFYKTFITC